MQHTTPYKLQLNLELSNSNILELLAQLTQLTISENAVRSENLVSVYHPEPVDSRATALIHELGIPSHIMGYQYLKDAVILTAQNRDHINAITKVLYPEIARRNNTTASRVERAIRHAIDVAFTRGNVEFITSLFGFSINPNKGKPTNSEFIAVISDHLRMQNGSV